MKTETLLMTLGVIFITVSQHFLPLVIILKCHTSGGRTSRVQAEDAPENPEKHLQPFPNSVASVSPLTGKRAQRQRVKCTNSETSFFSLIKQLF